MGGVGRTTRVGAGAPGIWRVVDWLLLTVSLGIDCTEGFVCGDGCSMATGFARTVLVLFWEGQTSGGAGLCTFAGPPRDMFAYRTGTAINAGTRTSGAQPAKNGRAARMRILRDPRRGFRIGGDDPSGSVVGEVDLLMADMELTFLQLDINGGFAVLLHGDRHGEDSVALA